MESKSAKEKRYDSLLVLYLVLLSSALSQPPPPEIPQNEEGVILDSSPVKPTSSDVTVTENGVTNLPTCSDLVCTLEFIPEHCRVIPVLRRNGEKCSGCWEWKASCKELQNTPAQSVLPSEVTCPKLNCTKSSIPQKCIYIEIYEYLGKMCEKCPVHKSGCVPDSEYVKENIQCPVQACTLQLIPDECREIRTFEYRGITCKGCPIWRQGCEQISSGQNTLLRTLVPRVSCPLLACDTDVPSECRVEQEFLYRGRVCKQCPGWREGCREQERLNLINFQNGNRRVLPEVQCPKSPCSDNDIPAECKIEQPYEFRGKTCYKCPIRSPKCHIQDASQRNLPELPQCPMMKCDFPASLPRNCLQQEFFNYRGKMCENCPSVKPECLQFVAPRPNVNIDPSIANSLGNPEKSCPLLKCQSLDIHPDCVEIPYYPSAGKMCKGCPKIRDGCMSSLFEQMQSNAIKDFPQIPERKQVVKCPVKACPMIYIPAECKIERPYTYMGITCYDCPTQKENCVTINSPQRPQNLQQMQCPMFGCPLIKIPPECRIERPFTFQGKTCYMCPQWREGCVPLPPKPNINIPSVEQLTTTESSKSAPPEQNTSEEQCPLMRCTKILIPPECREEQPYEYNGKVCYRCPKWKNSCRGNQIESTSSAPINSFNSTQSLTQTDRPSITDLKEIIPVSEIIDKVNAATCPPLRCPKMFIPINCRQESMYQFQGRTCTGCPTWRLGCYPLSGADMNMNANGILSFSLFNELFSL